MKSMKEKTLNKKLVYDGFLKLYKDDVELENGIKSSREYILHPGAAVIVAELPNHKLLMVKQWRHAVGQYFLEFPAGKVDPSESAEQTAYRELQEETGYTTEKLKHIGTIHPCIGYSNEKMEIYYTHELSYKGIKPDHDEFLEILEVSIEDLKQWISQGKITDAKTLGAFVYFQNQKK